MPKRTTLDVVILTSPERLLSHTARPVRLRGQLHRDRRQATCVEDARSMVTVRAARSSGAGLAVMQPINLGSGEDPILDLDRCGALSRLGQMVQRDHCIAQR